MNLAAVLLASCGQQGAKTSETMLKSPGKEISRVSGSKVEIDGITVRGPYIGTNIELFVKSENPEYDCINIDAISGLYEDFYLEGNNKNKSKNYFPYLKKSDHKISNFDIDNYNNNSSYKAVNIYNYEYKLSLDIDHKFVSFAIFSCDLYSKNKSQHVYHYLSNPYDSSLSTRQ
ncbi:hypothetical protein ACFOWX_00045 [Sphingorhabdus arenilitoris]|uniref:Lipoprotein n=1 Tax=Sphingorhabdus arenilitoris TaxID=1490041 RepID=A0ABV8RC87_9SPHN